METISYKLKHFEDSLDLLSHLIEKNKINIYGIPIVEVATQYLDYVHHMEWKDLSVASEFPVMTATLLDIKAKMLLPKEMDEEGEGMDPRAELIMRLLEYEKYRLMTNGLAGKENGALKHLYKPSALPPEVARYESPVDLDKLLDGPTLAKLQRIFEQVMKRKEDGVGPIRNNFGTIHREPVSPKQKIGNVFLHTRRKRRFSFRELLEGQPDKLEVVVTLLVVLELIEIEKIHLNQEETFEGMDIETLEQGGEEEELDLAQLDDSEG